MRFKAIASSAVLSFAAFSLLSASAMAAPQILGLIASAEPVPLTCVDGSCTAEISSLCLQQYRDVPTPGTAYRPAEGAGITLIVTGTDGIKRFLPVAAKIEISSLRQFLAVKVSLPEETVRRVGEGPAALSIAPLSSIIPSVAIDDPHPISRQEIAAYTGPLRATAEEAYNEDSARLDATRTLNQMINRLSENRPVGVEEIEPLWKRTVGGDGVLQSSKSTGIIKSALDGCRSSILERGVDLDLRSCLTNQHDILSTGTQENVWRALKPGS